MEYLICLEIGKYKDFCVLGIFGYDMHKFTVKLGGGTTVAKNTRNLKKTVQQTSVFTLSSRIMKGLGVSVGVSIGCLILLSIFTMFSESSYLENHIQYVMVAVTMVSIFIGSVCSTLRTESMGLIIGMVVGLLYVVLSIAISCIFNQEAIVIVMIVSKVLAGLAAGAIGGLVGVNL